MKTCILCDHTRLVCEKRPWLRPQAVTAYHRQGPESQGFPL
jgi:hypothetical protein